MLKRKRYDGSWRELKRKARLPLLYTPKNGLVWFARLERPPQQCRFRSTRRSSQQFHESAKLASRNLCEQWMTSTYPSASLLLDKILSSLTIVSSTKGASLDLRRQPVLQSCRWPLSCMSTALLMHRLPFSIKCSSYMLGIWNRCFHAVLCYCKLVLIVSTW